uniref:Large ribosomal subunit protein mL43 n=1 Tax=Trichuris muris TaxID=70415 RepID=A0A5S6QF42_TRIMR
MASRKFCKSRIYAWRLTAYPNAVLQNGVGRFIHPLKRLTFFFCKSSSASAGVRQFLCEDLIDFSESHPGVAVYVQPKRFKAAHVYGEYLNGRSASVLVNRFSRSEVQQIVLYMANRSGFPIVNFKEPQTTQRSTIQGFWNPFYHMPTEANVVSFPNAEFGRCKTSEGNWPVVPFVASEDVDDFSMHAGCLNWTFLRF